MAIGFNDLNVSRACPRPALATALLVAFAAAAPLCAQYPGQLAKSTQDTPTLRAISVLEWTGDESHPKASRLVPIALFDGQALQDAGIYLARPEPLSVAGEVEYELQRNGRPIGLYDIKNAGQEQGAWVGYGAWKGAPAPKPKIAAPLAPLNPSWNDPDDRPVLHRKHHADDAPANSDPQAKGTAPAKSGTEASDPDRPTLHKKTDSDSSASTPADDPDRPTLHKKTPDASPAANTDDSASTSSTEPAPDPDRPTLRKKSQPDDQASGKKKKGKNADVGHVDSLPSASDPDRPKLKRGKRENTILNVLPSLIGMPPDLNQAVAVSDARDLAQHQWTFAWADPADQDKTKASLQQIARDALGLTPPPAPTPVPAKRTPGRKPAKSVAPPPPPPAPLVDEDFRVFELAYGAGATFVYSAHTGGKGADDKHITLIAQPDLYGNVLVLLKNVTDAAHLDAKPRMRLVDAVDALADNRGELLFELRGHTERQFALYRVVRGQAERIFATSPVDIVVPHGS
ncbi:MAG: hypothetical protein P4L03_04985 [Terracidiphilus sp.]|nr:hypothetical protein [Terracidiphilus sp.]